MKKLLFTLIAVGLLVTAYSQEKIDIEKEKEAIEAVIHEETNAFYDKDFERFAATYVQDETNVRLYSSKESYLYTVGWEEFSTMFKEWMKNYPANSTKEVQIYF